jgi:Holliday junction resolvasome RuvABC ATP-dependent DNA helicase subunit
MIKMEFNKFKRNCLNLYNDLELDLKYALIELEIDDMSAKRLLYVNFFHILNIFSNIDGCIDKNEAELLNLLRLFFGDESLDDLERLSQLMRSNFLETDNYKELSMPSSITVLQATNYIEFIDRLKKLFFEFANMVIKIDDKITKEESILLQKFKEILFDNASDYEISNLIQETNAKKYNEPNSSLNIEDLLNELNQLTGLKKVKEDVGQLINFIKVQQIRKNKGMAIQALTNHLVFYGNPGTGKTTIARLLSKIYHSLGLLSKGHLIEVDRSGLVGGYVGQTALKTKQIVEQAIGGILFIDEAYTLSSSDGNNDYGKEAIEVLLKMMEDYRDDLIVIVAGYPTKMNDFLNTNPGLISRFNKHLEFEDYKPLQMLEIFKQLAIKSDYILTYEAREKLFRIFSSAYASRDETSFGNARFVRNVFEKTLSNQANRIVLINNLNDSILSTIEHIDIPNS